MNPSPFFEGSQARVSPTDLDSEIEKLAVRYSRGLVYRLRLPSHEQEDLQQDIHLALWLCCGRLNTRRGGPKTFLRHVVENEVRTIVARRRAARRDNRKDVGLDLPVGQRTNFRNRREEWLTMRLDVLRKIEELPTSLQRTAIALQRGSPTEVARKLNICRDTVYRHIKEIRSRFGAVGLDGYLQ